ncbi:hypothetical protein, partial [Anaerotruncus massiliensis (ex Liu et al. 2021)]|uniref:hypothetical protein n=1 Tax=Anaerotruncus massiliensis (ex Liu et al. 2021) TaxID=2321404 RepID=UPI003AB4B826
AAIRRRDTRKAAAKRFLCVAQTARSDCGDKAARHAESRRKAVSLRCGSFGFAAHRAAELVGGRPTADLDHPLSERQSLSVIDRRRA